MAVNRDDPLVKLYVKAVFGVPGSASDGLIGFGSSRGTGVTLYGVATIDLWVGNLPPLPEGGASRPCLRSRVDLPPGDDAYSFAFDFSPDGSKFAAAHHGAAYVYDVDSLTRLATFSNPSICAELAWAPDGQHVLVTGPKQSWFWDFSRPEAPFESVITANTDRRTPKQEF